MKREISEPLELAKNSNEGINSPDEELQSSWNFSKTDEQIR